MDSRILVQSVTLIFISIVLIVIIIIPLPIRSILRSKRTLFLIIILHQSQVLASLRVLLLIPLHIAILFQIIPILILHYQLDHTIILLNPHLKILCTRLHNPHLWQVIPNRIRLRNPVRCPVIPSRVRHLYNPVRCRVIPKRIHRSRVLICRWTPLPQPIHHRSRHQLYRFILLR